MVDRPSPVSTSFWSDVFPTDQPALAYLLAIFGRSLVFVAIALVICAIELLTERSLAIAVSPFEYGGAVLSVFIVFRTNTGYDRWWEARKLWGGIVNQSRNLATAGIAYGPVDSTWRSNLVRWTIAFAHATRRNLRGELEIPEIAALVGTEAANRIAASRHMPLAVMTQLGNLLNEASQADNRDDWALMRMERERMSLIDHLGACERILKTPLPRAYAISLRQFVVIFLAVLPLALVPRVGWLTPLVTLFVAYPLLALDQIAADLKSPFAPGRINSLPLEAICATIEGDLLDVLERSKSAEQSADFAATPSLNTK